MRLTKGLCFFYTATLLGLPGATMVMAADKQVAYREIFPTKPNFTANGWKFHMNANATDASAAECWGGGPGTPKDLPAVNSNPAAGAQDWMGFLWISNSERFMMWSDEFPIDKPISSIRWFMNLNNAADQVHAAVRVEQSWYVTAQGYKTANLGENKSVEVSVEVATSKWQALPFVPGDRAGNGGKLEAPAATEPAIALPAGKVTGYGIFCPHRSAVPVFDTFEITTGGKGADAASQTPAAPATAAPAPAAPITAAPAAAGGSNVAYREIFPTGADAAASGWKRHINDNATDLSTMPGWGEGPGMGDFPAVASKPADTTATWKGFFWIPNGDRYVFWTEECVIEKPITRLSWYAQLPGEDKVQVMLRDEAGKWIVSEQAFAGGAKDAAGKVVPSVLTVKGARWLAMEFIPGDMAGNGGKLGSPGAAAENPKGKITAFGLYVGKRTGTNVFDTFTIEAEGADGKVESVIAPPAAIVVAPIEGQTPVQPHAMVRIADTDRPFFGQVVIGGGGYLTGIYPSPAKAGLQLMTCDMVGPWRRDWYSSAWQLMPVVSSFDKMPGAGSTGAAMHPKDPKVMYADMGNGGSSGLPMGVYKSTDGGANWKHLLTKYTGSNQDTPQTGSRQWGPSLAVDANDPEVVYWATRKDGVWRTTDGGANWKQVLTAVGACRNIVVDPSAKTGSRSRTIHVGVLNQGIFTSSDGGETFAKDTGFNKIAGDKMVIRWLRVANDGVVLAAVNDMALRRNAAGWSNITPDLGEGAFNSIAIDREDSKRMVAVRSSSKGALFLRSTDGGKGWNAAKKPAMAKIGGWQEHFEPMMGTDVVELDPFQKSTAYVLDAFTLWQTENAWDEQPTFRPETKGCEAIVTLALCTLPPLRSGQAAPLFSGVSDIRGFRHPDIFSAPPLYIMADQDWSTYVNGIDFCEADPNIVYVAKSLDGTNFGRLLRSTDNGQKWVEIANPYPQQAHAGGKISVSATEAGRVVYYPGGGKAVVYTADGGRTWQPCKLESGEPMPTPYMRTSAGYNFATANASDRVDGKTFYAFVRGADQKGRFYVSRDGGATWKVTTDQLPAAEVGDSISPVQIVPMTDKAGELWMTLEGKGGLWHSTDFGTTWSHVGAFDGSWPLGVSVGAADPRLPSAQPAVYVFGKTAGDSGFRLHRSLDRGVSWTPLPQRGYEKTTPMIFAADRQTFGRVYLGTPGLGIWYVQTDQVAR